MLTSLEMDFPYDLMGSKVLINAIVNYIIQARA